MAYSNQYKQHITTEYDEQFKAVKELKWDPFVGKGYNDTKILIIGINTYALLDEDWGPGWLKYCETHRDVSRILIFDHGEHKPFKTTSTMFIEGAGKTHNPRTKTMFWESVAFNNFIQHATLSQSTELDDISRDDIVTAKKALHATMDILRPRLCLVWTTQLWKMGFKDPEYRDGAKVGKNIPRIVDKTPPIVGVSHPSWAFPRTDWLNFLLNDDVSKEPTSNFIEHLRNHPTK